MLRASWIVAREGENFVLGTLVNVAAILAGGFLGLLLKKGLAEKYKTIVNDAVGLAVVFVGAATCLGALLGEDAHAVLFIISLAAGGLVGELLNIEGRLEQLGTFLQSRVRIRGSESNLARGFVSASLLFCVGTMAVLGPIQSGLTGEHSILYAKAVLDGIISVVMASTLGLGVLFSAGSVLVYQGLLTLLAVWVSPYMGADMLREISIVGGVLIFAIGTNMLNITKIRVGNLLPAMLGPVVYYLVLGLSG